MERLKLAEVRSLLGFVRELYAVRDLNGYVNYVLSGLPGVVASELTAHGNLNPAKAIFKIIGKPSNVVTPQFHRAFETYAHEHPFTQTYMGGGDGRVRQLSDLLTRRQFHRLALYNEFFRAIDIDSEMVVWLPAPRPREITFAVHRSRTDFSERDRLLLDILRPHLIQAYRNAEAVTLLGRAGEASGQGLLLITPTARVEHVNDRALALAREYFGAAVRLGRLLPEGLARYLKHQEQLLAASDDAPRALEPLIVERHKKQLSVRLLFGPAHRLLLLEEHLASPQPSSLESLGLTRREAEVLTWVARGKTNDVIATILGLSYRTVEKHVENILRKLGVETRTAAASRALTVAGVPS